jgi:FixJ family two-component response regulator
MPETLQTVCIVEDDESVRRALRRLIRSVGLDVEAFATAEELLQSFKETLPACLILDVHLPGASGLELQRLLRDRGHDVPVIVITAYADEKLREQAMTGGAIAFLPKPFDEGALLEVVFQVMHCPG